MFNLIAGLTGFLEGDAENMKQNTAAKRAAEAKMLEQQSGFKRQLVLNSIKGFEGDITALQKQAAKGEVTLGESFRQSVRDRREYDANYKFGEPYNPPKIDYNTVDFLNGDYNFIIKDSSGQKVRFKADVNKGDINGLRRYMAEIDQNYLSAKRNNKDYFKDISTENLASMYSNYLSALSFVRSAESKEQGENFEGTNYLPSQEFFNNLPTPFYGGRALANALIKRGIKSEKDIESDINKTIINNKNKNVSNTVSSGSVELPNNKVANQIINIEPEFDQSVNILTKSLNVKKGDLYDTFAKRYYNVAGARPERVAQVFKASLYLGSKIPNIQNLSPNKTVTYGDAKTIAEINQVFNDSNLNFTELVFAMAPYMDVSAHLTTGSEEGMEIGRAVKPSNESVKSYAGKNFAGRTADIKDREKSFVDAENNYQKQQAVQIALEKFLLERKSLAESEGKGIKTEFVAAFISKLRALKEVAIDAGSAVFSNGNMNINTSGLTVTSGAEDDNSAENDKTLTQGYLDNLKKRAILDARNYGGGTLDEKVGRLQAMRITLAFQMARAADPSGRLSNQDIEQQFVKLAGNFGTEASALAGIQVAIDEFKEKAAVNKQIFDFVKDGDARKLETFRTIDALFVVNDIRRKAKANELLGTTKGSETRGSVVDVNKKLPNGMPAYTDLGTHLVDNQTFKAISKQTGKVLSQTELDALLEKSGMKT